MLIIGDSNDEDGAGALGFGTNLAAQGVVFFRWSVSRSRWYGQSLTLKIFNILLTQRGDPIQI